MPDWKAEIRARLAVLNLDAVRESEIVEEMSQHLEDRFADLRAKEAAEGESKRRVLEELSDGKLLQAELRRTERSSRTEPTVLGQTKGIMVERFFADLKYAARMLRKSPGFTAVAVVTLALGIGANLAIFAVVDSVLLRPLPFPKSDRLVILFNTYPKAGIPRADSSKTSYYERLGNLPAFSDIAIAHDDTAIVGDSGATEPEDVMRVSPDFFTTLGGGPVLGRAFTDEETTYQTDGVAILTDGYWREHFGADPKVIGQHVRVDGYSKSIVGVLPPSFRFLSSKARLYFPLSSNPDDRKVELRHSNTLNKMIARLKPGVSLAEAQAQVDAHNNAIAAQYPDPKMVADVGFRTLVAPLHADHVNTVRPILLLLQSGVFFLLLIGGVNLVNLLLIRASSRARESAIRLSLGASRWQLVAQVMTETVLLTSIGGMVGLAVGAGGIRLLTALGVRQLPLGAEVDFDGHLAVVAMVGAVVTGVAIAGPVAWFQAKGDLAGSLRSETRDGMARHETQSLRQGFVVAQIALAFILLAGAGLLGVSLKRAMSVAPGFRPDHVLAGQVALPWKSYPNWPAHVAFVDRLMDGIKSKPGVSSAGVISNVPFDQSESRTAFTIPGHVPQAGETLRAHYFYGVGGDVFAALGIPLREGRIIGGTDSDRRVCVVDEDFARRYWPTESSLGHRLFVGGKEGTEAEAFTIVGVVGAMKQAELTENQALGAVYVPYQFRTVARMFAVVRTISTPEYFGAELRKVVRNIDPELPVDDLRSMDVRIADSLVARRSPALLAGIFAGVALLLAAIGTYGVLSYAVAQRRREIGLRMALGAQRHQIGNHFLLLGLRLLGVGAFVGALGAWMAGRAMQRILFGVPALHMATFLATALVMTLVSVIACWLPARRATKVDPMVALRGD